MRKPKKPKKHVKVQMPVRGGGGGGGPVRKLIPRGGVPKTQGGGGGGAPVRKTARHPVLQKGGGGGGGPVRKWSPDEDVALCSARAVAEAVRLLSGPVLSDADVLALYWSTATTPDAGQTLSEALSVAQEMHSITALESPTGAFLPRRRARLLQDRALILGLDIPGGEPHAVVVDIDGTWWSWGEPYQAADFPGAVIEEAWTVTCP